MATKATPYVDNGNAIGLVNGTRVGGTRKPRSYTRAGECITYTEYTDNEDGTRTRHNATIFKPSRERRANKVAKLASTNRDISLMARMGSIHEGAA